MRKLSFFIVIFLTMQVQARDLIYRASYDRLESANYTGSMLGAQVQHKTPERSLMLGARSLKRSYTGAEINENAFDLGSAFIFTKSFYLELGGSFSPNSDILPRQTYSTALHWVQGRADFGSGLSYSQYKNVDATTLHPFYLYEFSDGFRGGADAFIVQSDKTSTALHGNVLYFFTPRHSLRGDVSGGETLEDAGVHAQYTSTSLEYGYHLQRWSFYLSSGYYKSDLRSETSYGLRLEFR